MNELRLINAVEHHPELFHTNHKYYNDNKRKELVWKEISGETKMSVTECKRTWSLLRDSLRRAIKKRKAKLSTSDADQPSAKKWKYEEEMAFVIPFIKQREKRGSIDGDSDCSEEETHQTLQESEQDLIDIPIPSHIGDPPYETQADDLEAFFHSVATTVKHFPPRLRVAAKRKVFGIISQMELSLLGRSNPLDAAPVAPTSYYVEDCPEYFELDDQDMRGALKGEKP